MPETLILEQHINILNTLTLKVPHITTIVAPITTCKIKMSTFYRIPEAEQTSLAHSNSRICPLPSTKKENIKNVFLRSLFPNIASVQSQWTISRPCNAPCFSSPSTPARYLANATIVYKKETRHPQQTIYEPRRVISNNVAF